MSTTGKKIPATGGIGRRSLDPALSPTAPARTPARSSTPTSSAATNGGLARTRSLRGSALSARTPAQRSSAGASNLSLNSSASEADEEARAESIALLDDLRERLHVAEVKAENYQKENEVLQSRLDDELNDQAKLEDKIHEKDERLELQENDKRDASRQMREMESIYEAERVAMTREKEEMANREEEMQAIIQRLKDSLSQKANGDDENRPFRSHNASPSLESSQFAPPSSLVRSDSRNNSKLLLQKDRLIESLRLELAEAQIKIVESENMGGGRLQEVERLLLESRMANARLMEDNESFQLLLSEKTLNGDFAKSDFGYMGHNTDALDALEGRTKSSSLADELEEAAEGESENYRRLEAELKASKDQNKALTLYINKIIERLLQHQDFEAILDQSSDFKPGAANTNKDLPPPPPPKESGPSLLQRAKSVVGGPKPRPRPMSQMPATHSALTDPDTAPSIPFGLNRSTSVRQARPQSEQISSSAFSVVNAMYKGPNGPISPPLHGPQTPRNSISFFSPPTAGGNPNAAARGPSGSFAGPQISGNFPGSRNSETSSTGSIDSGGLSTPPGGSPPREKGEKEKHTTFAGNKPRPLRLVQDQAEVSAKEAKRASWIGWAMNTIGKKEDVEVIRE